VTASDDKDGQWQGQAMARASNGKDRHRARQGIRRAVAAQWAHESSHRQNAHEKEGGIGHSCPCLFTGQMWGYFICMDEDSMPQGILCMKGE